MIRDTRDDRCWQMSADTRFGLLFQVHLGESRLAARRASEGYRVLGDSRMDLDDVRS